MDSKAIVIILSFIFVLTMFSGCYDYDDYQDYIDDSNGDNQPSNPQATYEPLKIACWNIQMYGQAKAHNETLVEYYAEQLSKFDIFIIQEIIDKKGSAVNAIGKRLPKKMGYKSIISKRAGHIPAEREQYAIFYNNRVSLIAYQDFTDEYKGVFERPPFSATFLVNNWTFTLYTLHAYQDNVAIELTSLETIIGTTKQDTLIMGTLYTDGIYYNETVETHFKDWIWQLNDIDTTVTPDESSYDRIIMNSQTTNNYDRCGIIDDVLLEESDHYLIYGVFNPEVS